MGKTYDASDIVVLEGIEPVRRRPAMYIGGTDKTGLHHLVWEILDNAIDEVINGYATHIIVELDKSREGLRITDNGRGIPVEKHPKHKKSALEIIMTTLHAGGKFDTGSYIHSGGLHGVGASVVNALSRHLEVQVKRDGKEWEQTYQAGVPQGPVKALGNARGTGTSVYFRPDPKIFGKTIQFDPAVLQETLDAKAYLHKGLKLTFKDGTTGETHQFHHEQGIQEYLRKLVEDRGRKTTVDFVFYLERQLKNGLPGPEGAEQGLRMEVALQWTDEPAEFVKSYVNGVATPNGGTHEMGLRGGIVKAVRNYIDTHNLTPKGLSLQAEDIREGMAAVLSVLVLHPQFQGQTKERLNNPEVQAQVDSLVRPALETYLNENQSIAETLVGRMILAARAREASREASKAV
ncbi:MAG: ATP-binding protein, partial [Nitrospirota bacterium]|nr:ATP-binding protein [Nitrospirota bacterium]